MPARQRSQTFKLYAAVFYKINILKKIQNQYPFFELWIIIYKIRVIQKIYKYNKYVWFEEES